MVLVVSVVVVGNLRTKALTERASARKEGIPQRKASTVLLSLVKRVARVAVVPSRAAVLCFRRVILQLIWLLILLHVHYVHYVAGMLSSRTRRVDG